MSRESDLEALEDIIDRVGAVETVRMVSEICSTKSEDASDDGDEELSEEWADMSEAIDNIEWE